MHAIHLRATSRRIPVPVYVAGIKAAIANPDQIFKHGLTNWWPTAGADIRREFREALADRINARDPRRPAGRKTADQWQRSAHRVAWNLNGRRIFTRERECPAELRQRLAHRLHEEG